MMKNIVSCSLQSNTYCISRYNNKLLLMETECKLVILTLSNFLEMIEDHHLSSSNLVS